MSEGNQRDADQGREHQADDGGAGRKCRFKLAIRCEQQCDGQAIACNRDDDNRQFGTEGYSGASLDSIATAVGVRKQTLLYYFPNKDALLEACLAAAGQRVAEEIAAALEGSPDPEERAEAVIHAVYELAAAQRAAASA